MAVAIIEEVERGGQDAMPVSDSSDEVGLATVFDFEDGI
jgi:hypothetical protein